MLESDAHLQDPRMKSHRTRTCATEGCNTFTCTAGDDPNDVTAGAEESGVLAVYHASLDALHRTEEPEEVRCWD